MASHFNNCMNYNKGERLKLVNTHWAITFAQTAILISIWISMTSHICNIKIRYKTFQESSTQTIVWSKGHEILKEQKYIAFLAVTWAQLFVNIHHVYSEMWHVFRSRVPMSLLLFLYHASPRVKRMDHPSRTNSCHTFCCQAQVQVPISPQCKYKMRDLGLHYNAMKMSKNDALKPAIKFQMDSKSMTSINETAQ